MFVNFIYSLINYSVSSYIASDDTMSNESENL
jgi:hypothetical protein